jgi:hypothetical protein
MRTSLIFLRQRSLAARHRRARRGDLIVHVPVGFIKTGGQFEKDPDKHVRAAIKLVFDKVVEPGSVRRTLLWFHEHGLELPAKRNNDDPVWEKPTYPTIYRIVANPICGGGALRLRQVSDDQVSDDHRVRWRGGAAHNIPRSRHRGAAKHGDTLLAGLMRCRWCGRKLILRYTSVPAKAPRYGLAGTGDARCIPLRDLSRQGH